MGIRIGWRGRMGAAAVAFLAALMALGATMESRWLVALLAWPVAAAGAWLAILGFPNFMLPRRFREADDALLVPIGGRAGESLSRWTTAFGQAVFALLGFGLAALFAFAPIEYLEDYFGARRGLPRALLDSDGGIVAARVFVTALGLFVGGFCAKNLWDDWRDR